MSGPSSQSPLDLTAALNDIPSTCASLREALQQLVVEGRRALGGCACTITFVDLAHRYLTHEACDSEDEAFTLSMTERRIAIRIPEGHAVALEAARKREVIERYNLHVDGGGIANPKVATKFHLRAALCHPFGLDDDRRTGYINHFSRDASAARPFTDAERSVVAMLARQAASVIDHFEARAHPQSVDIWNRLSESVMDVTLEECFKQIAEAARKLLDVPVCIVWKRDAPDRKLKIVETSGHVDQDFRNIQLDCDAPDAREYLARNRVATLIDVQEPHRLYRHREHARARHWVSLLTAQMRYGRHVLGMLDVYTTSPRAFKQWEKQSFGAFANHAALLLWDLESKRRLQELNRLLGDMTETENKEDLLRLVLERGLGLIGASRGFVSQLDYQTGLLNVVQAVGQPSELPNLPLGEGISGLALKLGEVQHVGNVRDSKYSGIYREFWSDTVSELAVPIELESAAVRVGDEIRRARKPIGVLNIESPEENAFSIEDVDIVRSLARQAAAIIDRLDVEQKLDRLRRIEGEIVSAVGRDDLLRALSRAATELGYEYVQTSELAPSRDRLSTLHVSGIPEQRASEFKRLAGPRVDGQDIHSLVVRTNEPFAPSYVAGFTSGLERVVGEGLSRVVVPIRYLSRDRAVGAIGTVEAAHKRRAVPHVYERDVQLLQRFVDHVALALAQQRRLLLEPISHEFYAPIVGIRSHAAFLKEWFAELPRDLIRLKLNDILTDSELLLSQVSELEHILGRPAPPPRPTRTVVMRDVVIKLVKQFRRVVVEHGFDPKNITYDRDDIRKMILYVDRARLSQVFSNLLTNAIRYAQGRSNFAIRIQVDESRDMFIVRFKDWGMGVKNGLEETIFEEGYRAPEAIERHVTGTGLGLTIARRLVRDLGGNLVLNHNYKPTEFNVFLPKTLKEVPRGSNGR